VLHEVVERVQCLASVKPFKPGFGCSFCTSHVKRLEALKPIGKPLAQALDAIRWEALAARQKTIYCFVNLIVS